MNQLQNHAGTFSSLKTHRVTHPVMGKMSQGVFALAIGCFWETEIQEMLAIYF